MPATPTKAVIAATAVALILARLRWPQLQIDMVTLGLLVIAVLPWLFSYVASAEFPGGWKFQFRELRQVVREQEKKIEDQQEIVNQLVVFSMAQHLFRHLKELYQRSRSREEYLYRENADFKRDLVFLRDHGYLESAHPGQYFNIESLRDGLNLIGEAKLTPVGNFYVEQRVTKEAALHSFDGSRVRTQA